MTRRTGLPTLLQLAETMCGLVIRYQRTIREVYPDAIELHAALDAALVACEVLALAIGDVLPVGD